MKGRRIPFTEQFPDNTVQPGDYWKDSNGHWHVAAPVPRDDHGFLLDADVSSWGITEHEDGTITVSTSIFWGKDGYPNSPPDWAAKHTWHGFLEHGEWRSA